MKPLDPLRIRYFDCFLKGYFLHKVTVETGELRCLEYGLQGYLHKYLIEECRSGVNGVLLVLSECVCEEGERRRVAIRMLGKIIVTCTEIERIRALAILASLPEGEGRVFNRYVVKAMASPCLMLREVASSIPIMNWDGVKIGLIDLLLDGIAEGR